MIFGEKYYGMLKKLSPWRQSLFSLVLAQRQYPVLFWMAAMLLLETSGSQAGRKK